MLGIRRACGRTAAEDQVLGRWDRGLVGSADPMLAKGSAGKADGHP